MNLGGPPIGTSFLDLLRNFETNPSNVPLPLPNDNTFEADNDFGFDEPNSQYSEDTDITLWSIAQNGEFKVYESKSSLWLAKCKTLGDGGESSTTMHYTPRCVWYVCAIKKKNHHMWRITRWVDEHNCFGSYIGNNNRNLNSATIASYILHSIQKDVEYPVKQIQADIKNSLNVDVSYWKAWHGRRKAIETIYGTWESNFAELPKYITALKSSNPNTVMNWFHNPNGSSDVVTFKGKMLVAVTKDANNNILPIAYAIVDEESAHSWCWFFYQFRHFVAQDRQLCVISDRHQGIIHAMTNLEEWKEPLAYHRFCLRHIRSNLMKRSQWCLLYDKSRRWGFLTTNISESMNNALRGARQLLIKACIDLTFNRTVQLFRKHSDIAMNCNTPLPSRMWRLFVKRETHAQSHNLTEFDYNEASSDNNTPGYWHPRTQGHPDCITLGQRLSHFDLLSPTQPVQIATILGHRLDRIHPSSGFIILRHWPVQAQAFLVHQAIRVQDLV
ncbi:MULE transposase domain-containing protein, partial [Cynara cardunculus var. scolymus]